MNSKAKLNYKVGDKVFALKNSSWGLKPMKITENDEFSVLCKHPDFVGIGYFRKDEIEPFSIARNKKLKKILTLEQKLRRKKEIFFGNDQD